jgi:hypothetical protein
MSMKKEDFSNWGTETLEKFVELTRETLQEHAPIDDQTILSVKGNTLGVLAAQEELENRQGGQPV